MHTHTHANKVMNTTTSNKYTQKGNFVSFICTDSQQLARFFIVSIYKFMKNMYILSCRTKNLDKYCFTYQLQYINTLSIVKEFYSSVLHICSSYLERNILKALYSSDIEIVFVNEYSQECVANRKSRFAKKECVISSHQLFRAPNKQLTLYKRVPWYFRL